MCYQSINHLNTYIFSFYPRTGHQLEVEKEEEIEGANIDQASQCKGKTTICLTYFLPVAGPLKPEKLKPDGHVGDNKVNISII